MQKNSDVNYKQIPTVLTIDNNKPLDQINAVLSPQNTDKDPINLYIRFQNSRQIWIGIGEKYLFQYKQTQSPKDDASDDAICVDPISSAKSADTLLVFNAIYSSSVTPLKKLINQFFQSSNSHNYCSPTCLTMDIQCETALKILPNKISLKQTTTNDYQSYELLYNQNVVQGYTESLCISCTSIRNGKDLTHNQKFTVIQKSQADTASQTDCSVMLIQKPQTTINKAKSVNFSQNDQKYSWTQNLSELFKNGSPDSCILQQCYLLNAQCKIPPGPGNNVLVALSNDKSQLIFKANQNVPQGYSQLICVQCSLTNGQIWDNPGWTVQQTIDFSTQFQSQKSPNQLISFNYTTNTSPKVVGMNEFFLIDSSTSIIDVSCVLKDKDCGQNYVDPNSQIRLDTSYNLLLTQNVQNGYGPFGLCFSCSTTNSNGQTQFSVIQNGLDRCPTALVEKQNLKKTVTLQYSKNLNIDVITGFEQVFQNSQQTNCSITQCRVQQLGCKLPLFTAQTQVSKVMPWKIQALPGFSKGYELRFCYLCLIGSQKFNSDGWKIIMTDADASTSLSINNNTSQFKPPFFIPISGGNYQDGANGNNSISEINKIIGKNQGPGVNPKPLVIGSNGVPMGSQALGSDGLPQGLNEYQKGPRIPELGDQNPERPQNGTKSDSPNQQNGTQLQNHPPTGHIPGLAPSQQPRSKIQPTQVQTTTKTSDEVIQQEEAHQVQLVQEHQISNPLASVQGPQKAPWQKKVIPQSVINAFAEQLRERAEKKNSTQEKNEKEKILQVEFKTPVMDYSGNIKFSFNQLLVVPSFVTGSKRFLEGDLSQIDVQRDIMDVYIISGEQQLKSQFYLTLLEWTETHIIINTNFTNPTAISQNSNDWFKFNIKNPNLFVSQESGLPMSMNDTQLNQELEIPKQLPKGVSESKLQAGGQNAKTAMNAFLFIQIVAQVGMKAMLDFLMLLFIQMQFMGYMQKYSIAYPPNANIFNSFLISFIEFQVINPQYLIQQFIDPTFSYARLISTGESFKNGEDISGFQDFSIFIIMLTFASIGFILFIMVAIIPPFREKAKEKGKKVIGGFMFAGLIRSFQIAYIKQCITFGNVIKKLIQQEAPMVRQDLIIALVSLSYIVLVFIWCVHSIIKNRDNLGKEEINDKFGKLYLGITGEHRFKAFKVFYFPYFLLRCFIYIMIGTLFVNYNFFEVMFLMQFNVFCTTWYFTNEPHSKPSRRRHEGVHECFMMIAAYHLMYFTNAQPFEVQFTAGYTYFGFVLLLILFNLVYLVVLFIDDYKHKQRKKEKKKSFEASFRENIEIKKILFQKILEKFTSKRESIHSYIPMTYKPYVVTNGQQVQDVEKKSPFKYSTALQVGSFVDDSTMEDQQETKFIQNYIKNLKENAKALKKDREKSKLDTIEEKTEEISFGGTKPRPNKIRRIPRYRRKEKIPYSSQSSSSSQEDLSKEQTYTSKNVNDISLD